MAGHLTTTVYSIPTAAGCHRSPCCSPRCRCLPQVYAVARRQQAYPAYVLEVGPEVQPKQPDVRHGSFTLQEKSPDRLEKPKEAAGTKKGACCVIL